MKFIYTREKKRIYLYSLLFVIHTDAENIFFRKEKKMFLPKNKQNTHTHKCMTLN